MSFDDAIAYARAMHSEPSPKRPSFNPGSPLARLLGAPMRAGSVCWLGVRPERRAAVVPVEAVRMEFGGGIVGDHYAGRGGAREVTLIGEEQLRAIAGFLGRERVGAEELRRNVVVRGVNLHALRGCRVRLGEAVVEVTGECHPCSRMEAAFGAGGYNAVRGHGGVTARVVEAGEVRVGSAVSREPGTA